MTSPTEPDDRVLSRDDTFRCTGRIARRCHEQVLSSRRGRRTGADTADPRIQVNPYICKLSIMGSRLSLNTGRANAKGAAPCHTRRDFRVLQVLQAFAVSCRPKRSRLSSSSAPRPPVCSTSNMPLAAANRRTPCAAAKQASQLCQSHVCCFPMSNLTFGLDLWVYTIRQIIVS